MSEWFGSKGLDFFETCVNVEIKGWELAWTGSPGGGLAGEWGQVRMGRWGLWFRAVFGAEVGLESEATEVALNLKKGIKFAR